MRALGGDTGRRWGFPCPPGGAQGGGLEEPDPLSLPSSPWEEASLVPKWGSPWWKQKSEMVARKRALTKKLGSLWILNSWQKGGSPKTPFGPFSLNSRPPPWTDVIARKQLCSGGETQKGCNLGVPWRPSALNPPTPFLSALQVEPLRGLAASLQQPASTSSPACEFLHAKRALEAPLSPHPPKGFPP